MSLVGRPLPVLPSVFPALAKNGVRCRRAMASDGTAERLRSRTLVSCAELPNGSCGKELGVPECHDRTLGDETEAEEEDNGESLGWSKDEVDVISALFDRPMPQKPAKPPNPAKARALPLPSPHKTRMPARPAPKLHVRLAARAALSARASFSDRVRKNPEFLVGIAREIAALPPESDVSVVLDRRAPFLRKGSLSMTIRELGHMGLPLRALQTLCWAQKQTAVVLFPDDRTLSSTIEVVARFGELRIESELEQCVPSSSRAVLEAMARGFIRAGRVGLARKVLELAKIHRRTLHPSIHAKLMLEAARTPEGYGLASALLNELSGVPDFDLPPQDCTAVMKVCVKLSRFDTVESLFSWFRQSGRSPTVVMYTTVIHSRYCEGRYREGLALVWEMEGANRVLDLPAYRVVIRLCAAMNDMPRAFRYLSRLKEAGFAPTSDIYRDMIERYAASGRTAKWRQLVREAEMAGVRLDRRLVSRVSEMEHGRS